MDWDWFRVWGWFWSWFRGLWFWDDIFAGNFLRNGDAGRLQVVRRWLVLCRLNQFLGLMRMLDRVHGVLRFWIAMVIIILVEAGVVVSTLERSGRHFVNFRAFYAIS